MENELQRRIDSSGKRSQRAKKLINEKAHQVLINEINTIGSQRTQVCQAQVELLEKSYRTELIKGINDESLSKDMPL